MNQVFRVAIHHENDNGYIEYDLATKALRIELANVAKRREVEDYLTSVQTLRAPQETLLDFKQWQAIPTEDLANLKIALAKVWEKTDVYIDWSRPI